MNLFQVINTPEGSRYWRRSGVLIFASSIFIVDSSIFIADFEHANIGWFYWRLHARFIDYYAQSKQSGLLTSVMI